MGKWHDLLFSAIQRRLVTLLFVRVTDRPLATQATTSYLINSQNKFIIAKTSIGLFLTPYITRGSLEFNATIKKNPVTKTDAVIY